MITADTITDEQIRELRDGAHDAAIEASCVVAYTCDIALGKLRGGCMGSSTAEERHARARCAEILNARAAKAVQP